MKWRNLFIGLGISAVVLSANPLLGAQEKQGADSLVLKASQGSVVFPHGRHQKVFVDCTPCHDLFPKEAQGIEKMKSEGKLKEKQIMDMCKNCHEKLADKGEKAGPTACKECHKD
ncbi:MAG TPA: cytochrome c3 family protein [Desulfurivibrionaceae bacterium]|nr:cytochrome c3 family protein [Desulfurivibrionaceae bacterium]